MAIMNQYHECTIFYVIQYMLYRVALDQRVSWKQVFNKPKDVLVVYQIRTNRFKFIVNLLSNIQIGRRRLLHPVCLLLITPIRTARDHGNQVNIVLVLHDETFIHQKEVKIGHNKCICLVVPCLQDNEPHSSSFSKHFSMIDMLMLVYKC